MALIQPKIPFTPLQVELSAGEREVVEFTVTFAIQAIEKSIVLIRSKNRVSEVELDAGSVLTLGPIYLSEVVVKSGRIRLTYWLKNMILFPGGLANLDVALSTRASESTLQQILSDLQQVTTSDGLKAKPTLIYGIDGTGNIIPIDVKPFQSAYGLVGILYSTLLDNFNIHVFGQASWYASITATQNTSGLSLITTYPLPLVEAWVRCGGACTVNYYVSRDNTNWRPVRDANNNIVQDQLTTAGEIGPRFFRTAYRYFKVEVPTPNIDIEIEIVRNR